MKVIAKRLISHDNVLYTAGSVIEMSDEQAKLLISMQAAKPAPEVAQPVAPVAPAQNAADSTAAKTSSKPKA